MTKIFIDTNIFLGLYESNEDTIEIFKDIEKVKDKLVFPRQVYDEFLRNRDQKLRRLKSNIKTNYKIEMHPTSLVRSSTEYNQLEKIKEDCIKVKKSLIQKIEEMIVDSSKDPIFSQFIQLYNSASVMKIERSDALIQKAFFRKLTGNPPISSKKDSVGDGIIWESLLEHVTDDLILISRDGDFKDYSTFLIDEYRSKTEKSLFIVETLSEALKYVGEEPSDKLVQFEEEQKKRILYMATDLSDTLEGLNSLARAIDWSHFAGLSSLAEEVNKSYVASLGSVAETAARWNSLARAIDWSHFAGLSSLAEKVNKSYVASLGSVAETAARWNSLARAMDISPFMRQSDMVERLLDSPSRNLNYLSTGYDSETSEWLEGDVNENQEESAPDESSQKKDYTTEETQVETKADKDIEQ
ncbi:MAG TPA: PIN domain-containing protein [Fervidobacterium sp.]|nr:PIN domain-containing protein [Fervidobacterium sp.]HUM44658.1 PIN domain-containing protein [Fervidobacterium sp.]